MILVANIKILGGTILVHADRPAEPGHASEPRGVDGFDQRFGAGAVFEVNLGGAHREGPFDNVAVTPILAGINH